MKYVILLSLVFCISQVSGQEAFHHFEIEHKARLYSKMQFMKPMSENQKKYDVNFYKLQLEAFPDDEEITASVRMDARVVDGPLKTAEINLVHNLQVDSVLINGVVSSFTHENDLLKIDLDRTYQNAEAFSFTIFYQGEPALVDGFRGFDFSTHNGKPIFWTSSEPYEARTWWPCKDYPEDKADSVDIVITVPEGMIVASNGLLSEQMTAEGKTTFYWKERYPIATYLVSLAAYAYKRYSDEYITLSGDTMSIDFFVFPEHYNNSEFRNSYALTKTMIKAFSGYFGEYPFSKEKYGHAEWGLGGQAMEHQTCSSMGTDTPIIIAHELAHQWWGDLITCENFQHVWLNEGCATYSEALWREYSEGKHAYHEEIAGDAYIGGGTIFVDPANSFGQIFDLNTTYFKASYVLHMLRHVVGDSLFFKILKAYHTDLQLQYGTAVTEDFKRVCEEVSGMQLGKFFDQWIYGEYCPSYEYSWACDSTETQFKIDLTLKQTQTYTGLFWMPLDVQINSDDGDTTFVVWDSLETQNFELFVDNVPKSVKLDPENWVLASSKKDVTVLPDNALPVLNKFVLYQNYPNPFNPKTVISYQLPVFSEIDLSIYNILGQKVVTLVKGKQQARTYKVEWDAGRFASGIYLYKLTTDQGFTQTKKLVVIK